jgi:hypothetical protein
MPRGQCELPLQREDGFFTGVRLSHLASASTLRVLANSDQPLDRMLLNVVVLLVLMAVYTCD